MLKSVNRFFRVKCIPVIALLIVFVLLFPQNAANAADNVITVGRPKISVSVSGDSVIVTIKKTSNAEGYLIYSKAEEDLEYEFVGKLEKDGTVKRRYTFNGLSKGNYYVKVKAYSGTTTSRYSKAKKAVITSDAEYKYSDDSSDFVLLTEAVPDAILEIRYYSTYNFIGDRIDGYEEPLAFLTKDAGLALKEVSDELKGMGYRLKIFDAYRPQKAVTHFMNWALDFEDVRMKEYFYPDLEKDVLFPLGYIDAHSGHSRGSTVDLTLFDMKTEKEVDMGGTFDHFGELSHPDYKDITEEQYNNRMLLREVMIKHGFKPLAEEWWHFTLADEPYPDTYFTFPVNSDCLALSVE